MYRPKNWKNKYAGVKGLDAMDTISLINKRDAFEAGADAMLSGLLTELLDKKIKFSRRKGVVGLISKEVSDE